MLDKFLEDYLDKDHYRQVKEYKKTYKYLKINRLGKPVITFMARGEIFASMKKTLSLN